jgi:hypothetical protein
VTTVEIVARSRAEQGLPEHVEDEGTLLRIAALLGKEASANAVSEPADRDRGAA